MAIRDIITRWNYTHAMIRRALILRQASSANDSVDHS